MALPRYQPAYTWAQVNLAEACELLQLSNEVDMQIHHAV
jgi:hypothetical protein